MKKISRALLLMSLLLPLCAGAGGIGTPQEDESMARVQRLLMAPVFELSAEQLVKDSNATGYQDFPAYKRFLQEAPNTNYTYQILLPFVSKIDGSNMRSKGDSDFLRLTREFLIIRAERPDWQSAAHALLYLSQKGDSGDLPLVEKYATLPSKLNFAKQASRESLCILRSRIFGTNILNFSQTRYYHWSTNSPPFLPSVANTGPQAVYVYDLLKQALDKYGSATNIPPEILTLTVTFDAAGKPVCSIDQTKYGLVMPSFVLKKETLQVPPQKVEEGKKTLDAQLAPSNVDTKEKKDSALSSTVGYIWLFVIGVSVLAALILFRINRH